MKHFARVALVAPFILAAVVCLSPGPATEARQRTNDAPILGILQSELRRNFEILRKDATPAYFMGYTVHDERSTQIIASFGALDRTDESRGRFGTVEVRVGDYALDNTHPIRGEGGGGGPRVGRISLPLTDDDQPVKLAFWRATDRAFKLATESLTRVRTNVAAKVQDEEPAPDFSREQPQIHVNAPVNYSLDTKLWEGRLRRLSAPFAEDPLIFNGSVSLSVRASNRFYTNGEGSQLATGDLQYRLFIQGITKAADGMELPLYNSYFSRTADGLPDEKQLLAAVREMMSLLARLRTAPLVDPFTGPAILSGRAAGVFFHEIFGHRVEGHRQREADDAQTFAKSVGRPILPSFLSVVFDPTRRRLGNTELHGYYQYDDEGVKARPVTVVEDGVLKTFLLGRAPLTAFPRSNGHGRAQPGYVPVSR